jgi:hypothetical protein
MRLQLRTRERAADGSPMLACAMMFVQLCVLWCFMVMSLH